MLAWSIIKRKRRMPKKRMTEMFENKTSSQRGHKQKGIHRSRRIVSLVLVCDGKHSEGHPHKRLISLHERNSDVCMFHSSVVAWMSAVELNCSRPASAAQLMSAPHAKAPSHSQVWLVHVHKVFKLSSSCYASRWNSCYEGKFVFKATWLIAWSARKMFFIIR